MVKNPPANTGDARPLGQEEPLEREMAARSSILAWKIPRTEEPHSLRSMGSQTTEQLSTHMHAQRILQKERAGAAPLGKVL